jgi:hypothetical protein
LCAEAIPNCKKKENMKKSNTAPPAPNKMKDSQVHGQTESTAGREQVREELHHTSAPRESNRPNERTTNQKKK